MQPFELSLAEAARALRSRELSPVELTESVLARIGAVDGRLRAYATVAADAAAAAAVRAEREISETGPRSPLHGIPMGLKDLIDAAGLPTTASSDVRAGHIADHDSRVAVRLKAAGAVLLGKTHTHEFAYGLTTPQTSNAWDQSRVAGGSSGGSAVAVAAGEATFALGTDTGGSIRVPAALNGVVGLKPTYGLVSRSGVTSLSWSLDHVGPLTRSATDAALVLAATAGYDPRDPASVSGPPLDFTGSGDLKGLRVGIPRNHYFDRVSPEVEEAVRRAIDRLTELGAKLVEVEIPMARYIQAIQWGLMVPEATAYHERSLRTVPDLYTPDVRALLEAGELDIGRRLPARPAGPHHDARRLDSHVRRDRRPRRPDRADDSREVRSGHGRMGRRHRGSGVRQLCPPLRPGQHHRRSRHHFAGWAGSRRTADRYAVDGAPLPGRDGAARWAGVRGGGRRRGADRPGGGLRTARSASRFAPGRPTELLGPPASDGAVPRAVAAPPPGICRGERDRLLLEATYSH